MIDQALGSGTHTDEPYSFENVILAQKSRELAEVIQRKKQQVTKERYDERRQDTCYHEGDLVWIKFPNRKVGRSEKLLHQFRGPFRLIMKTAPNNFMVQDANGKQDVINVDRFKPFHERNRCIQSKNSNETDNSTGETLQKVMGTETSTIQASSTLGNSQKSMGKPMIPQETVESLFEKRARNHHQANEVQESAPISSFGRIIKKVKPFQVFPTI